ncbi:unnamed protein product [Candida verbasci]|uniref:DUF1765-domain-containing protein n=1 Tax=Candida verbasci TaxID=1227364 RepID=A0A9W4TYD9_9ASCO|nr:unnamed protein product [Candida verbasci]
MANVLAKAANITSRKQQQYINNNNENGNIVNNSNSPSLSLSNLKPPPPISPNQSNIRTSSSIYIHNSPKKSSTALSKLYTSPKSITSISSNSPSQTASHKNDKIIKNLLKRYKKLETSLNKFNSKKYNHNSHGIILKGNILRTSLLPFLRSTINPLNSFFNKNDLIYKSLTNVILNILIKWWQSLINNLNSTAQNDAIPSSDRNAYLECISRIAGKSDLWEILNDDREITTCYNNLLISTSSYCIEKMSNLKNNSLSFSAFVGKIFAICFFKLPEVSNALLFLLNVKQITYETTMKKLNYNSNNDSNNLYLLFPSHLHYLINFNGLNLQLKGQKCFLNCLPPPKHPVNGISNPNGDWVRRWCCSDSNVFNSFLHHYINIIHQIIPEDESINLLNLPGFNIIISHIYQIFNNAISPRLQLPTSLPKFDSDNIYFNSIVKIFKTLRDVIYNGILNFNFSIDSINAQLVQIFDSILIQIAKTISIYEFQKFNLILSIFNEFVQHILNNLSTSEREIKFLINWEFWLDCNYTIMKNSNHVQSLIKNFAFVFNIWDMIPEKIPRSTYEWITIPHQSFKFNFINFLISDENLITFLSHWNPLVRSYYIKLLIWRILGVNNYQNSNSIQLTKLIQVKLNTIHEIIRNFTLQQERGSNFNFKPDSPLVNRKFQILLVNSKDELFEIYLPKTNTTNNSELRKIHPYEVFDEAIYTCSTIQPMNDDEEQEKKLQTTTSNTNTNSNLIVNSIGKLFKILSIDDNNKNEDDVSPIPPPKVALTRNSKSLTSLNSSNSTTPSIMSNTSTPTSITESDQDEDSIVSIDTINNLPIEKSIQPPELNRLPPSIIRPIYKFDIVVDHESINEKLKMIRNGKKELTHIYFPKMVKIPIISIYNRNVYISEENEDGDNDGIDVNELSFVSLVNLGKSMNEINAVIDEFKFFIKSKIECEGNVVENSDDDCGFYRKIIPFLSVDSTNEMKLLNAN